MCDMLKRPARYPTKQQVAGLAHAFSAHHAFSAVVHPRTPTCSQLPPFYGRMSTCLVQAGGDGLTPSVSVRYAIACIITPDRYSSTLHVCPSCGGAARERIRSPAGALRETQQQTWTVAVLVALQSGNGHCDRGLFKREVHFVIPKDLLENTLPLPFNHS